MYDLSQTGKLYSQEQDLHIWLTHLQNRQAGVTAEETLGTYHTHVTDQTVGT